MAFVQRKKPKEGNVLVQDAVNPSIEKTSKRGKHLNGGSSIHRAVIGGGNVQKREKISSEFMPLREWCQMRGGN